MKRLPHNPLSRLLALALILVLMTTMFAGCFSNADPTEPSDDPSVSATEGTDATEGTEEAPTTPPATEPEAVMGTVNTDKLNVRTKANSNSPSVNKLAIGTQLEILEQLTVDGVTWGRIEEGWVNMKYVTLEGAEGDVVEDPGTTEPTAPEETTPEETTPSASTGSGTMGTVTASSLHVRKGPGTKYDSVGKVSKGDRVEILETSGNWGKTSEGWISLKYVKLDGSSDTTKTDDSDKKTEDEGIKTLVTDGSTTALGQVVIDTSALYVRYGPGTKYAVADKVYEDETVTYYQKSGNWVRIKEGWISLSYTKDASSSGSSSSSTTYKTGTGKVTASALYIREGAGASYKAVDKLYKGDSVEILEVSGNWGRIDKGWICLDYVKMD